MAQLKDGTRVYGTFTANTEVVIGTLNVASTLVAGYGVANAAFGVANAAYNQTNAGISSANSWANTVGLSANTYASILAANNAVAANAWANTVGVAGNNYTNHVGLSVNTYASILVSNNAIGANNWANTVGVSGNSYTDYVGLSVNTYASILVANNAVGANAWANTVGVAGNSYTDFVGSSANSYTDYVGSSANSYTNSVGVAGNNYTDSVGVSGNSYTDFVGAASNNYASILVANNSIGANNWANTVGVSGNSYTDHVGQSGNAWTFVLVTDSVAGANGWANTVGYAGNNYTSILVAENAVGANNWANTKLSNATGTLEGTLTVTGNLGVGKSPEYNLDVNGQSRLGSGVNAQNPSSTDIKSTAHTILGGNGGNYLSFGQYGSSNNYAQWVQSSYDNPTTAVYDLVVNPLGGNVGIGKVPSVFKLDIGGSINSAAMFVNGLPVVTGSVDLSPANNYSGQLANTANLNIATVYASVNSNWVVTNTVYDVANAAFASANNVAPQIEPSYVTANLAYLNSNAAYGHSNVTYDAVNSAFTTINASYTMSNASYTVVNASYTMSNASYNTTNTAYNHLNVAYVVSNSAFDTANSAYAAANNVGPQIAPTFNTANAAYNTANAAFNHANTKFSSSGGTISGSVEINADLTVHGNTIFVDQSTLRVGDPLIYLAANNYTSDVVDIGFVANYVNTGGQNVHTGLYRSSGTKEYYLFYGYDREPYNNYIDPAGNNITMAVLNAAIRTSNLNLGGTNTINWITSSYNTANASFDKVNATATAANSYTNAVGAAGNSYSLTTATNIGTAGNNYTNYVGASANAVTATKVASVSGTSGRITSSGGTTPTIDLATAGAGAATYSSGISALTVDAYGRLTSVTGNANYITNSISSNFTTTARFIGGALQFDSYGNWNPGAAGGAAICNDNGSYQALMIVGNNSAGGSRIVKVWDNFIVNGSILSPAISSPTISGTVNMQAAIANYSLTDGANIAWDLNTGQVASVTLGGARTMNAPSNMRVGTFILHVYQDGTGSRTLTWASQYKWPAGVAPVLTSAAGRHDIFSFICDGTNMYGSYLPDVR